MCVLCCRFFLLPKSSTWKEVTAFSTSLVAWNSPTFNSHSQTDDILYLLQRCSPDDAGEYKVVAKSLLGKAVTFGTLVVNCEWFLVSSRVSFAQKPVAKMEYSTIAPKTLKSLVSVRLAMRHWHSKLFDLVWTFFKPGLHNFYLFCC